MSGLYSRRKGMRCEYEIRDIYRAHGWLADRVPSSGAAEGFKGDIHIRRPDGSEDMLVEVKARKKAFTRLYDVLEECPAGVTGKDKNGLRFFISPNPHQLMQAYVEQDIGLDLSGLVKLMGPCQVLVLKDDRRPPIFIQFVKAAH
jgi:hypothetical protein